MDENGDRQRVYACQSGRQCAHGKGAESESSFFFSPSSSVMQLKQINGRSKEKAEAN